jgi:hypothetical protein
MPPTVGRVVHYFPETWGLAPGDPPFYLAFVGAVHGEPGADQTCTLMVCEPMASPRWVEHVPEGDGSPRTWRYPPRA